MALTWWRWLVAAVLGCAVIGALVVHQSVTPWRPADPVGYELATQRTAARRHARAAAERLRVLELRDSLMARAGDRTAPMQVSFDQALPARIRTMVDSLIRIARSHRPDRGGVPLNVVVVLDTMSTIRGVPRTPSTTEFDYLLPGTASNGPCVSMVRLSRTWLRAFLPSVYAVRYANGEDQKDLFLGPCVYYAAFGAPGPHIAEWLRARGWRFARSGTWSRAQNRDFGTLVASEDLFDIQTWFFRTRTTPHAQACATGDLGACRAAFFDTTAYRWLPWGGGILSDGPASDWWPDANPSDARFGLGPAEVHLLADMERWLGEARFERFWTSSLPVEQAFAQAAGIGLDEWTREWAQGMYGVRPRGAEVGGGSIVFGVLLALIAIGSAVVVARRRRVG